MTRRTDVAVVGGGVVGLSVARTLQSRGHQVTVIDRDGIDVGCSTGNAGLVVPSHVVPLAAPGVVGQGLRWLLRRDSPFRIKPRLSVDLFRWLWTFYRSCSEQHVERSIPVLRDLSLRSRALYEEWSGSGQEPSFGFRPSGLLMLHATERGREADLEEAERAREAGLRVGVLDRSEVEELASPVPPSVRGGVYYEQDGLLEPLRLVRALKQDLESQGGEVLEGAGVTGFERENGVLRSVRTTDGPIEASEVVLAAGSWSAPLGSELGLDIPIQPAKGYSVTVNAEKKQPSVPFILTEEKVTVTPMDDRIRFAGTLELAGFDASVDSARVQPILDVANQYVSNGQVRQETVDPWVGFRPCTPDGLPVIGQAPGYENLVLATGHCMLGVSLAPVTGQLVGEIIEGEDPSVDLGPLHLSRFN